jgi:hypothetical protein
MDLTKPMIQAFKQIIHGVNTIEPLSFALNKSISWTSQVVSKLEDEEFIVKKKGSGKSRIALELAGTEHALKLRDVMFEQKTINFEEIISDSKLLFLAALSEDWISVKEAAKLSGISIDMIRKYKYKLQNRGVFAKEKTLYTMDNKMWPLLRQFILAYKNYSTMNGFVKWRFQDEVLFKIDDEKLEQGEFTGFYAYENFGVKMWVVSALCYLPKKKLSKEEIFIHSLFQVEDPRTLNLALTFYLKNKLKYKKILPLAMKYGKYSIFTEMVKLLNTQEKVVEVEGLPAFDRIDFFRIATMYNVKGIKNPGPYKRNVKREFTNVQS